MHAWGGLGITCRVARVFVCVIRYAENFFQLDEGATARLRAEVALDGKEGLMLGSGLDLAAGQKTSGSHKTWSSPSSLWWTLCGVRSGVSSGAEGAGNPEVEMVADSPAELHNEQVQGHSDKDGGGGFRAARQCLRGEGRHLKARVPLLM